jgi:polysaccharide pyruvyl transferase WcaK-like protein
VATVFNIRPTTPNVGNDVLAAGLESLLRSRFGDGLNLVTLGAAGPDTLRGGGLSPRNIYEINLVADGVVIGPGNLFENGGLHVDAAALSALSVPVMLFSVSLGRIYDRDGRLAPRTDGLGRDRIEALCRLADPVLVRDRATAAALHEWGVERVEVGGCPTLTAGDEPPPRDPATAGCTLVSVRHPGLMSVPYAVQMRMVSHVGRVLDLLRQRGHDRLRLLCHDSRDLPFARAFPDTQVLYTEDPRRFLGWLRGCRLQVGFRLHAFLPCVAMGVPAVHISYDERAVSLIETAGLAAWDVNLIRSGDFLADVSRRLAALPRLEELRRAARPAWDALRETMTRGIDRFAARVEARLGERMF